MLKETLDLLDEIGGIPASKAFTLVGGTAIAFHANHRLSEDLDFATFDNQLNPLVIKQILNALSGSHEIIDATSVGDIEEALNAGYDLLTRQQNWLVDKLRLSFFIMATHKRKSRRYSTLALSPISTPISCRYKDYLSANAWSCLNG